MPETYGNPHKLPPIACGSNIPTWTDPTITASVTKPRKPHVDELRTKINLELTRRGITNYTFTDTITATVTKFRKLHIDQLRDAVANSIKKGDCAADTYYCPQDTSGCADFTDPTVTASVTKRRKPHIDELRAKLQALMTTCICEAEQCEYCSDCGYKYAVCSHNGVACNDHQSGESCAFFYPTGPCGSRNTGGVHPFKTFSTSGIGTPWDGYVPWTMGSAVPGIAWTSSPWSCKCNPYSYDGICTHCGR
jgi:hypothetical protein